jgi:YjbE family integral membrane protein
MDGFGLHGLTIALQILLVDLMLGADNALLIGLASRSLPPADRKRAAALGVAGAIGLRLVMTMAATTLLALPLVKLIGAVVLIVIALNLAGADDAGLEALETAPGRPSRLWSAAAVIVFADAVMSVDNVVALAAIAQGNYVWLLIGVGLSLPMLGYGGLLVAEAMQSAPGLVALGAASLGWVAGGMAVSDALWAHGVETRAPGLAALAPGFGAAFVYLHGLLVGRPARTTARPPPVARPARATAPPPKAAPIPAAAAALAPEPEAAAGMETRVMLAGVLLLALVAGGFLVWASYVGGLE